MKDGDQGRERTRRNRKQQTKMQKQKKTQNVPTVMRKVLQREFRKDATGKGHRMTVTERDRDGAEGDSGK